MQNEPYPEHAKLTEVRDRSQTVGEFLEWLQDVKLVRFNHDQLVTVHRTCRAPGCQEGEIRRKDHSTGKPGWFNCEECEGTGYVETEELRDLPFRFNIQELLAEYFGIDLDKLETEKRDMLEAQRELNRQVTEKGG